MAHITTNAGAAPSMADRISTRLATLRADFAKWRVYRRTMGELQALSNRDLADLGVHPSNIRSIAWEAAYGK